MEARDIVVNFEKLINYSKNHDVVETAKEITNIFSEDELITEKRDIDQAYFELHSKEYLIKGGNGLNITVISGDCDRFGNHKTHEGISIFIFSDIIKHNEYYALFTEDRQYEDNSIEILSLVNESLETVLNVQQTLDYFKSWNADPMLFNILSDELKNNNEIIMQVLNLIDENANSEHRDQRDYESISPNGGLDIIVSPSSEIYLDMIDKFDIPGNEDFMQKAKIYFMSNTANCKFIDEELKRFDKIIYYAEHADDYRYNESILQLEWMNSEMDMLPDKDQLLADLEEIKIRLGVNYDLRKMNEKRRHELNSNLDELKGKTYNFLGYFTQKPVDRKKIVDMSKNLESLKKSDQELLNEFEDMRGTKVLIEMDIDSIEEKEQKLKELKESQINLKYPYNYLLKDLFAEIAHAPELFENSLQRQIDAKESIIAKRNEYSELLNFTNRTPELYNIKREILINEDNNQDIRYICGLITDKYAVYINGGDDIRIFDKDKDALLEKEAGYSVYSDILSNIKSDYIKPLYDQVTPYINMFENSHDIQNESEDDMEL